jgi:hypothetical protein
MRRNVAIVVGALLLLVLAGFGIVRLAFAHSGASAIAVAKPATCADAYRILKLAPSQISAANSVCLTQSLQLSGEVIGGVGEAYTVSQDGVEPTPMCGEPKRWSGFPQALLAFVAAGRGYRLRISAPGSSEHQPVTLNNPGNVVELASISDPSQDWSQASGSLALNPDGVSGNLDVNLLQDVAGAQPIHLTGQWACGATPAPPAFDASAPCSTFYALNQLSVDDTARMKASACHVEDLTFRGNLSGHLDHAITDPASSPHIGFGGDNFCTTSGQQYEATLKFSIGDESFLLDLDTSSYGGVLTGQYPAQGSGTSIGVVLFLGHADPSNHGAFATDDQVFWLASSGSFSIDPGMKSGTIDATLTGQTNPDSSVQIKGTWRCAA